MNEATGKVFWELYELSKAVEPDTDLETYIQDFMSSLEKRDPNKWTADDYMNIIEKAYNRQIK